MRKIPATLAALVMFPFLAFASETRTVTLDIQNMTCPVCPITVKSALQRVTGVHAVSVDFKQKAASVTYDPDKTKPDDLVTATGNAGFPSAVRP